MKKLTAITAALFLFASTSGLVFAQGSTTSATPTVKKVMKHKTHKKVKKMVKPVSSPVSK
ncbi:MAG TPA: hypothetical protein VN963_02930 [bacterium]|nr:hypothetical protein [bacterium]